MTLEELFEKQKQLDDYIMLKLDPDGVFSHEDVILERIIALQVEIAEFANATRCFKYWSKKEPDSREHILEELSDCWHLLPSLTIAAGFTAKDIEEAYLKKHEINYQRQLNNY